MTMPRRPATGKAAAVREIVSGHVANALEALRDTAQAPGAAVHLARKELKRARAGLRLLRAAVGRAVYRRENAALRDAARPLSRVRDAEVMLGTVTAIGEDKNPPGVRAVLLRLRRALLEEQRQARTEFAEKRQLTDITQRLQKARDRVARLRLRHCAGSTLATGFARIYRTGRGALRQAQAEAGDAALHELRKQIKYLGAAMKILDAAGISGVDKRIERADAIAELLGDDHDLAVLQSRIAALDNAKAEQANDQLGMELRRRRARLQQRALRSARLLYRQKARDFLAELHDA